MQIKRKAPIFCTSCMCSSIYCLKVHINQKCVHNKGYKQCEKTFKSCPYGYKCLDKECVNIHPDEWSIDNVMGGSNKNIKMCRKKYSCTSNHCMKKTFHNQQELAYKRDLMPIFSNHLNSFNLQQVELYNIDESHGLEHHWRVSDLIRKMCANDNLGHYSTKICVVGGMMHDIVDHKYCKGDGAKRQLLTFLKKHLNASVVELIWMIIDNMSYSKCNRYKKEFGDPYHFFNKYLEDCPIISIIRDEIGAADYKHHLFKLFDIVRHADVIDSYPPARCLTYVQQKLHPTLSYEMQFLHVLDLFLVRMFKYLSDGWITRPDTIEIARAEHKKAIEWFLRMNQKIENLSIMSV